METREKDREVKKDERQEGDKFKKKEKEKEKRRRDKIIN